ncbi:hypothetical protein N7931_03245 [Catenovulum sp. 2E275]|uniref:hypothetical protein n=1 Tax=Catenovulum sp. 2E275 TaxID=2980497 RepID=UPI0021D0DAEC|nr:hypothetical protein [Catenovulum sp. 2E275]MCU4674640.1 hypothetical protein [Catenovulum sp. 2E275]
MKLYSNILIAFIASLLSACSQKMAYQSMQESGKSMVKCELITDHIEREKCFAQFDMTYEEYQQEREKVLKYN